MENKELKFGTAGIRGIMKEGVDGINEDNVAKVASGYADYLNSIKKNARVVIGHDTRHNSYKFAEIMAKVLLSKGVSALLYENNHIAPTPLVSFTIREMKLDGGVMITASHNPKEYNGIKIYHESGRQILPNEAQEISALFEQAKVEKVEERELKYIDEKIMEVYLKALEKIETRKDEKVLKIAYSPVQGTGMIVSDKLLDKLGYEHFNVEDQMIEDPNFENSPSLNPEEAKAYVKLLKTADKNDCDAAFICDPDADRIGVAVKDGKDYKILNGNEIAALYINYLISEGKVDKNSFIATTVPSGHLAQLIAKKHSIKVDISHVGFKNIANLVEKNKDKELLIGYEESYGSVIDSEIARDKDSFQAMVGYAEMLNMYKLEGINVMDILNDLYEEYGYIFNDTMALIIDQKVQDSIFSKILDTKQIKNYEIEKIVDFRNGAMGLDPQNLLKVYFKNEGWIAIRPSGTEPKVKVYIESKSKTLEESKKFIETIKTYVGSLKD